jgi:O-methyltransferase
VAFWGWLQRSLRFPFWIAQVLLGKFGWALTEKGLRRIGTGEYTLQYPYPYVTFSPWFAAEFQSDYARIADRTTSTEQRAYTLRQFARHCAHLNGDFAECGVYRGGTALLLSEALADRAPEKTLHLFDSFQGMPPTRGRVIDAYQQGDLGDTSLAEVQAFLADRTNVTFHPGFIPGTLQTVADRHFAFVHLDVDIYRSTHDALAFFYDRLVPGAIVVCDDYGFVSLRDAARAAFDDFLCDRPEQALHLPSGQCLLIRLAKT